MQVELGPDYYVVEDGVNGRTTAYDDPVMGDKNGLAHLATALKAHKPIDLLVIMLGTNNLKRRFSLTAEEIAQSLLRHLDMATKSDCGPQKRAAKSVADVPTSSWSNGWHAIRGAIRHPGCGGVSQAGTELPACSGGIWRGIF